LLRGNALSRGKIVASNSEWVGSRRYRGSMQHLYLGKPTICDQVLILDSALIRPVDSWRSYRADTTV
ncbi:hypothetical protein ASPBRDRAFT_138124, partial [Aspergillus brasiliensis CBS 101740]